MYARQDANSLLLRVSKSPGTVLPDWRVLDGLTCLTGTALSEEWTSSRPSLSMAHALIPPLSRTDLHKSVITIRFNTVRYCSFRAALAKITIGLWAQSTK